MLEFCDVRTLAHSKWLIDMAEILCGSGVRPVRGLFFNKTPESNWPVAWHRDLTIAVNQKVELPGYGPWSTKAGVVHVQPPLEILENMITFRLHLDDCPVENENKIQQNKILVKPKNNLNAIRIH